MSATAPTAEPLAEALIVGAGPVGLYQAFQLGLQGIHAHIVDVLPMAGGQCAALYPAKLIHDIPALPPVTGLELTERLLAQIQPFRPTFHLSHEVASFEPVEAPSAAGGASTAFRVSLQPVRPGSTSAAGPDTRRLDVQFVFIAAGVGAFQPKPLRVPGLDAWLGRQVFQHRPDWLNAAVEGDTPWPEERGRHVVVYGADDDALDTVLALRPLAQAHPALRISLVHRREPQVDDIARLSAFRDACAQGLLHFELGQPVAVRTADGDAASTPASASDPAPRGRLAALQLADANDHLREIPVDVVLACQGLSPKLGPLAHWGLALERKQVPVDTARFATALPGVYAVGDVNTYPGKRKLIACGFHEAVLAGFDAAALLSGGPVPLEYTTSSAKLQQRLGVAPGR